MATVVADPRLHLVEQLGVVGLGEGWVVAWSKKMPSMPR